MRRQTPRNCFLVSAAEADAARAPTRVRRFMMADSISSRLGERERGFEREEFAAELSRFPAQAIALHETHPGPGRHQRDGDDPVRRRRQIPARGAEEDTEAGDSVAEDQQVVGKVESLVEIVTVRGKRIVKRWGVAEELKEAPAAVELGDGQPGGAEAAEQDFSEGGQGGEEKRENQAAGEVNGVTQPLFPAEAFGLLP